jgi:hypothetical protein
MCHGIFPIYAPKLTSFWHPGTLNQAAHPATDMRDVAAVGTRRPGPFGGYRGMTTLGARPCPS